MQGELNSSPGILFTLETKIPEYKVNTSPLVRGVWDEGAFFVDSQVTGSQEGPWGGRSSPQAGEQMVPSESTHTPGPWCQLTHGRWGWGIPVTKLVVFPCLSRSPSSQGPGNTGQRRPGSHPHPVSAVTQPEPPGQKPTGTAAVLAAQGCLGPQWKALSVGGRGRPSFPGAL